MGTLANDILDLQNLNWVLHVPSSAKHPQHLLTAESLK